MVPSQARVGEWFVVNLHFLPDRFPSHFCESPLLTSYLYLIIFIALSVRKFVEIALLLIPQRHPSVTCHTQFNGRPIHHPMQFALVYRY